jgi:hypothetical protein
MVAWITSDNGSRSFDPSIMTAKLICSQHLLAPMPQKVTTDLCERDLVPKDIADCSITPPHLQRDDTWDILRGNIQIGVSTHQSVKEDFGKYETSCSKVNQLSNRFWCGYNLSGEGPIITILYDAPTQTVDDLHLLLTGC